MVLVNCDMQVEETNTHALYPYTSADSSSHLDDTPENLDDVVHEDVNEWTVDRVKRWLCDNNLSDMIGTCTRNNVSGRILLQLDDEFARDTLEIQQAVKRRQLVRLASRLKKEHMRSLKEKTLDELDEYVLVLETHRIKLVAKLKAIFDRFDSDNEGVLDGVRVEQALLYMDRPVDSVEVNSWINKLKDRRVKIDFTEFVAQYSALFSGHDPDVPVGEASRKDISHQREPTSPRMDDGTGWRDDDSLARPMSGGDERLVSSPRDKEDMKEGEVVTTRPGIAEQDLADVKFLAEMKTIFDRFAVDGVMNAAECCQALSEAGLVAPRREFVKHLKSRKHIGTSRTVSFFEFMRAFASIRGPVARSVSKRPFRRDTEPGLQASELRVGAEVELITGDQASITQALLCV